MCCHQGIKTWWRKFPYKEKMLQMMISSPPFWTHIMSETSDPQKFLKTHRSHLTIAESADNPSCATVSNLQNYIPLKYEIIHIFRSGTITRSRQLSGPPSTQTGSAVSLSDNQSVQFTGFIKRVRSFSCCVDQLTINFKLVIQGHSTPGSTAEYTYI